MEINSFESHGRTICVQFRCYRCKTTAVKTLENSLSKTEPYRELYDLIPPQGWRNGGFYYPLFCPDCAKKYDEFMRGESND